MLLAGFAPAPPVPAVAPADVLVLALPVVAAPAPDDAGFAYGIPAMPGIPAIPGIPPPIMLGPGYGPSFVLKRLFELCIRLYC